MPDKYNMKFTDIDKFLSKIQPILQKKYGKPNTYGTTRIVYSNNHVVIKIPRDQFGIKANEYEYENFQQSRYKKHELAKCKLTYIGGIPVIIMEKIDDNEDHKLPKWAWKYDGGQVGLDKKGNFKAFDYGYPISDF